MIVGIGLIILRLTGLKQCLRLQFHIQYLDMLYDKIE